MKFCKTCGYGMDESAAICTHCNTAMDEQNSMSDAKLKTLADRVRINGIVWLVIGIMQLFFIYSIPLGLWNIYAAYTNLKVAKEMPIRRVGLVRVYEPIVSPIINLVLNLILGAGIGVIGSLYYLIFIRGYVLENRDYFNTLK